MGRCRPTCAASSRSSSWGRSSSPTARWRARVTRSSGRRSRSASGGARPRGSSAAADSDKGGVMKANCWYGKKDVRVEQVPDPKILNKRDAIVKITSTAICGSDLHLYNGFIPTMQAGDILGHEFMGEIVEVGPEVHDRKVGDRVVVSFPISCGKCFFCEQEMYSLCENTNPNA